MKDWDWIAGCSRVVVLASMLFISAAVAETPSAPGGPTNLLGAQPTRINSENAIHFKRYFPPEVFQLFGSAQLEISAALNVAGAELLDLNAGHTALLTSNNPDAPALRKALNVADALPYGGASVIQMEPNVETRAQKILLNASAVFAKQRVIDAELRLFLVRDNKYQHALAARFVRNYVLTDETTPLSSQYFREALTLQTPQALAGYSWTTYRFIGADEDMLWVYSPATAKVRQLSNSNRGDDFLQLGFSVDDLFTWSGSRQSIVAQAIEELEVLMPVETQANKLITHDGDCVVTDRLDSTGSLGSNWNFQALEFPRGAAWLPARVIFVPRKVWKILITPNDPYAAHGRQILYIDQGSFLPVYKEVFERNGALHKIVFSVFGSSQSEAGARQIEWRSTVAVAPQRSEAAMLDVARSWRCGGARTGARVSDLEPIKAPKETAKAS